MHVLYASFRFISFIFLNLAIDQDQQDNVQVIQVCPSLYYWLEWEDYEIPWVCTFWSCGCDNIKILSEIIESLITDKQ